MTNTGKNLRDRLRSISPPKFAASTSGSPPRGKPSSLKLRVTVVEAKNLCPKDKSGISNAVTDVVGRELNTDDPFCKLKVGKRRGRTSVKINTLSPKWGEQFILVVVVRDNVAIGLYQGHFFGEVCIPIYKLQKGVEYEEWFPLTKRKSITHEVSGSLLLKLCLQSDTTRDSTTSEEGSVADEKKYSSDSETERSKIVEPEKVELNPSAEILSSSPSISTIREQLKDSESTNTADSSTNPPKTAKSISLSAIEDSPNMSHSRKGSLSLVSESKDPITESVDSRGDPKRNQAYIQKFNLPPGEVLIKAYSAALLKQNILHHGRLYVSLNWFCFYSNIFGIKTMSTLQFADSRDQERIDTNDIIEIQKNKSWAMGISITTTTQKYIFASFFSRESAYMLLERTWKVRKGEVAKLECKEVKELTASDNESSQHTDTDDDEDDSFLSSEDDRCMLNSESSSMKQLIVEEFPLSLMKFFKIFFFDGVFATKYHEERGDTEIVVKEWTTDPTFGTMRQLQYRAPVKYPMGPSSALCEETQRYHLSKTRLTVETILVTYEIPFGDSFRVEGKWEVTPTGPSSCKLVVCTGVHFVKKTWFKGKIEAGSIKETQESFNKWVALARKEIAALSKQSEKQPTNQPTTQSTTGATTTPKAKPGMVTRMPSSGELVLVKSVPFAADKPKQLLQYLSSAHSLTPKMIVLVLLPMILLYMLGPGAFTMLLLVVLVLLLIFLVMSLEARIISLESQLKNLNNNSSQSPKMKKDHNS